MTRPTQFGPTMPVDWQTVGGDPALPGGQPTTDCCDDPADLPDRALHQTVFIGSVDYANSVIADGPEWYYRFEESSGTFVDSSGNAVVATTVGSPTYSVAGPGPVGGVGITTVTTDALILTYTSASSTAQTIEGWFRTSSTGYVVLMQNRGSSPGQNGKALQLAIGVTGFGAAAGQVTAYMNVTSFWVGKHTTGTINDGNWHHVAATWTASGGTPLASSQITIYIDGVAATTANDSNAGSENSPAIGSGNMTLFANVDGPGRTADVDADEMAFYHTVLSAGTIADRYAGGTTPAWVGAGPNITDGDDATCQQVIGTGVVRVWLGTSLEIARMRLVLECETAGARTYVLKGANVEDYSDAVPVRTINFTATGAFAAQTIDETWIPLAAYEFWELTGDDETRNVCSFELYEAASTAVIDAHIADTTDAHDASAISIVDAGTYFTGTDVEAALQEIGAAGGASLSLDGLTDVIITTPTLDDVLVYDGSDWVNQAPTGSSSGIYLNVKDAPYSAVGDDSTDDTAAIQAAIDALEATGGTIFFPTGTYKITSELLISPAGLVSDIRLLGESATGELAASVISQHTANTNGIRSATNEYDLLVEHLKIKGPTGGSSGAGLYGNNRNVSTAYVRTEGFYYGLRLGSSSFYSKHYGSLFYNAAQANVLAEANSNNMSFTDCHNTTAPYGYDIAGCESPSIIGGSVEGCTTAAIRINGGSSNGQGGLVSGVYFEQGSGVPDILIGDSSAVQGVTLVGNTHIKASHGAISGWSVKAPNVANLTILGGYTDSTQAVLVDTSSGAVVMSQMYRTNSGTVTVPAGSIILDTSISTAPSAIGTAAHGSSPYLAPINHVHATGAGTPSTQALGDAAATGSGPAAAMTDHKHAMPALSSATPLVESGAGSVGTALPSSREDHVHPAAASTGSTAADHEHIQNVVFSGDASTTVWELPAAPVDATGVAVYVAGSRSIAWALSGTLLTTLTFDSAPASAANNIVIDIEAAVA